MNQSKFPKGSKIRVGNFVVSIGTFKESEVAIQSVKTGEFVKINRRNLKVSSRLRRVKKNHKTWLNNDQTFCFSFMTPDRTQKLINDLK